MTFLSKFILFSTFSFSFFAINFSLISNYFRKKYRHIISEQSGRGGRVVKAAHDAKTQVRIPLGDIYMVKILNKWNYGPAIDFYGTVL